VTKNHFFTFFSKFSDFRFSEEDYRYEFSKFLLVHHKSITFFFPILFLEGLTSDTETTPESSELRFAFIIFEGKFVKKIQVGVVY